jgi:hypothetical protein
MGVLFDLHKSWVNDKWWPCLIYIKLVLMAKFPCLINFISDYA